MVNHVEAFPIEQQAERRLDRRRFIGMAACGALLVAAGDWLAETAGAAPAGPFTITLPADIELAEGGEHAVTAADGREALVVKLAGGTVVAYDRRCPHLGCPVVWSQEQARFECPCHHAAFDARTGAVLFGPPRRGLARVEIARG